VQRRGKSASPGHPSDAIFDMTFNEYDNFADAEQRIETDTAGD
jgi:hypothetical protein